ncbi:MAG: hypothetical protein RL189_778 [Pseudomonadota bacterium]|jgi:hypothetical protein
MRIHARAILGWAVLTAVTIGCTLKYRLAPLSNKQNVVPPPTVTQAPNQTKQEFENEQSALVTLYAEPYVPSELLPHLRGKIINVYDKFKPIVCFTSVEQPCQGRFIDANGEVSDFSPDHTCWLTNPEGFVHLRIINRKYHAVLERWIKLPPPILFRSTLREIGDTSVSAKVESSCKI